MRCSHKSPLRVTPAVHGQRLTKSSFNALLSQEILREVEEVDRYSFKKRADYFENDLKLSFGDNQTLAFVDDMMTIRNEISRENLFRIVPSADLQKASKALMQIPAHVCLTASKLYPIHFL